MLDVINLALPFFGLIFLGHEPDRVLAHSIEFQFAK